MAFDNTRVQKGRFSNPPINLRQPLCAIDNIQTPKGKALKKSTPETTSASNITPYSPDCSPRLSRLTVEPSLSGATTITSSAPKRRQGGAGVKSQISNSRRRCQQPVVSTIVTNSAPLSNPSLGPFRSLPFHTNAKSSHALQLPHAAQPLAKDTTSSVRISRKRTIDLGVDRTREHRASIVPASDPQLIKVLWKQVMSATRGTIASRAKGTRGNRSRGRGTPSSRRDSSHAGSETSGQISNTASSRLQKPGDPSFYETVLLPRGISIDGTAKSLLATTHFSTSPPKRDRMSYYLKETNSALSKIWLDYDIEEGNKDIDESSGSISQSNDRFVDFVIGEYEWMVKKSLCEAEFATFAKEHLIRGGARYRPRDERLWATNRMVEVVTKPATIDSKTPALHPTPWWSPPTIHVATASSSKYTYDIRPDCQYWLSLGFANPIYKRFYTDYVYEVGGGVCPYFTVEFKKDSNTDRSAQNQLVTAAALALYNRCILKHEFLQAVEKSWSSEIAQSIRHYGLTFSGCEWQFWCITPQIPQQDTNAKFEWGGCMMFSLDHGKLTAKQEVEDFITWINEIHRWGLTLHGKDCETDVKGCIGGGASGVRVSDAHLTV